MKLILVMVSSVDGKITKGDSTNISSWTSKEDQKYFSKLIQDAKVIIMGSKTYETAKEMMRHKPERLRVVATKNRKYTSNTIKEQLEFSSNSPKQIINSLENRGFSEALLVGGSTLNASFLKENLVDELWLTLEPKIFGQGNALVTGKDLDITLKLIKIEKLNSSGTLLLKYKII